MGWQKSFRVLVLFVLFSIKSFGDSPELVNVALNQAFVPIGFDSNDRTQVTVAGIFPDGCYRVGETQFKVDENKKTIFLNQTAHYYEGGCLDVLVPFSSVVDLGMLKEGNYVIKDQFTEKTLGNLPITLSKTKEADDFLYAPVTDSYIRNEPNKNVLFLRGNFTTRCMTLKDVKVNYYDHVVVVQPIADYRETPNPDGCQHETVRFQYEVPLKAGLTGYWLLHVRTADGQAINRLSEMF